MKKLTLLLALLMPCPLLFAQRNEGTPDAKTFTVDFSYANYHVFRGLKESGETMQSCVEAPIGQGYVGAWASTPLERNSYYEVDFYGGVKIDVTDRLQARALLTLYMHPNAQGSEARTTYEAGLTLAYKLCWGIKASARGYYDFRLESATIEGGVAKSIPVEIGAFKTSLDFDAYAGTRNSRNWNPDGNSWHPGIANYYTRESYNYHGANLRIPYKLGRQATLHATASYANNDGIRWPEANWSFRAGLTITF